MNKITFRLNNKDVEVFASPTKRVLDILRNQFDLFGTKEGCGEGECGACSILVNNKLINSCLLPLGSIEGKHVMTIEGLSATKQGIMLRDAFALEGAVQCGICTPGMMMASHALLSINPTPTIDEIKIGLSGNLCRCTGYNMIINGVLRAAKDGDGLW